MGEVGGGQKLGFDFDQVVVVVNLTRPAGDRNPLGVGPGASGT